MKALATLALLSTSVAAFAGATTLIFHEGAPSYFSGTFCRADAMATVTGSTSGFVRARLKVGGETVSLYEAEPGVYMKTRIPLSVVFDSTYFGDQSYVQVEFSAVDTDGVTHFATPVSVQVRNKALLGNHHFDGAAGSQSSQVIANRLYYLQGTIWENGNYSIVINNGANFTREVWKSLLPGSNLVYVSTHGVQGSYSFPNHDNFWDGPTTRINSHANTLDLMMGPMQIGTLPPYNTPALPAPNFVFIDSCHTLNGPFDGVLWPIVNHRFSRSVMGSHNSCVGGWMVAMNVKDTQVIADQLFRFLTDGWPARMAILRAIRELQKRQVYTAGENGVLVDNSHVGFGGDPYTKVAGVYTFSNDQKRSWL